MEIYDFQELHQSDGELICRGAAKIPAQERNIEFYLKAHGDEEQSLGYELIPGR